MRGNITRRGKHSWRIKFDILGVAVKRETRYVTVHGSRARAQAEAARIIDDAATG
jgi:hypothetical protein